MVCVTVGDLDRVRRRLDRLWEIGRTDAGGVTRLAYSDAENEAFDYLRSELPSAFETWTDSVGNLFATPWPDADRSVHLGSHLDTVVNGGRLDGTLGVVVALEAIQRLHDRGPGGDGDGTDDRSHRRPPAPPTLAVFRAEESARFGQHTVGSRAALGRLTVEAFGATDANDVPLWHAMQRAGFHPTDLAAPTIDLDRVAGFLEVHIEQGRVLDEAGDDLGVVTDVRAPVRHEVTVEGAYDHSGATPMGLRRDALAGAAAMVTEIRRIAREAATEGDLVATVGDLSPVDGAMNVVCGEVGFPLDVRSVDESFRDETERRLLAALSTVADERELTVETREIDRSAPVTMSTVAAERLERAAAAATATGAHRLLPSGGGHDVMNFQRAGVPAGLLFVPSVDGVSHSPAEETYDEAVAAAVETLVRAAGEWPPRAQSSDS
jgi:allantoate deiminase